MALPIAQRRARNTTLAGAPREFEDIYDQMGQLINAAFGEVSAAVPWSPPADVYETEDAYIVETEVPGARKDQMDLQLNERELVVSGEITERLSEGILTVVVPKSATEKNHHIQIAD